MVEVHGITPHGNHGVDGAGAAQRLAAGIGNGAKPQAGLQCGGATPVFGIVPKQRPLVRLAYACRLCFTTCLDQHATRRPGTDDHNICHVIHHNFSMSSMVHKTYLFSLRSWVPTNLEFKQRRDVGTH